MDSNGSAAETAAKKRAVVAKNCILAVAGVFEESQRMIVLKKLE